MTTRPQILLVEDDANLGLLLRESLEMAGFDVDLRPDGLAGLDAFRARRFDLALLDVVLPKKDGFALAREIRAADADLPVIFLTARAFRDDRIEGLRIGADDYVTKPFNLEELILRIHGVLRRAGRRSDPLDAEAIVAIGRYRLDPVLQTLTLADRSRRLTHKESELLRLFAAHINRVVERDLALTRVWGSATPYNARSMDVFISRLRKYLREDPAVEIQTLHAVGYRLVVRRDAAPGGAVDAPRA